MNQPPQNNQKQFKPPPKKHQPRGLSVIYEDRDILVVNKINGLLTVSTDRITEETAYFRLTEYVKKGNSKSKNQKKKNASQSVSGQV